MPKPKIIIISTSSINEFREKLINWWHDNGRDLPWRKTRDPFHILISEIMLQRTNAKQAVPIFEKFIRNYPTPNAVTDATVDELKLALHPLGLPQRVDQIIRMTKQIEGDYQGKVPDNYTELRTLSGVGDYIASAVCCFGFEQPTIIVDTNTVRIVGRIYGITTHAESRRKREIREKHQFLLDTSNPRAYNYALLDLGALICTPREPLCNLCPVISFCKYANRLKAAPITTEA